MMEEVDILRLKYMIRKKLPFRIGRRGFCLEFYFNGQNWFGRIPRGDVVLYFSMIRISDNEDNTFSCECPGWCPLKLSLNDYDKLTDDFVWADRV